MIALTIEQMKILREKGLTPEFIHDHSSMMWVISPNPHPVYKEANPTLTRLYVASGEYYSIDDFDYIPTFTLGDILSILPAYSLIRTVNGTIRIGAKCGDNFIEYKGNSELEIAYQMLLQCLDNNCIK